MRLQRVALFLITALALVAIPRPAEAAPGGAHGDVLCRPTVSRPNGAGLLMFHPGAFWIGATRAYLRAYCKPFAKTGYVVLAVDYPVRDLDATVRHARRSARALQTRIGGGPLFAYGESAGGTLAALLSVEGKLDAAVAVAAPTDLLRWEAGNRVYWHAIMRASRRSRRAASPYYGITSPSPLLLLQSPMDSVVSYSDSVRFLRMDHAAKLGKLSGDHLTDSSALGTARRWLHKRLARWHQGRTASGHGQRPAHG